MMLELRLPVLLNIKLRFRWLLLRLPADSLPHRGVVWVLMPPASPVFSAYLEAQQAWCQARLPIVFS
jgi:hypothetical protein